MKKSAFINLLGAAFVTDVFGANFLSDEFIKKELREFETNSKVYMNTPAPKSVTGTIFFDHETVSTSSYIEAKYLTRKRKPFKG